MVKEEGGGEGGIFWGRRVASWLLRGILGLLFIWAGWSKFGGHLQTLASIYAYQIVLPDALAEGIATALPWVEILLGLALLTGVWPRVTLGLTAVVLVGFTALTAQAWWRELPIECGCMDWEALHSSLAVLGTPGGAVLRNLVLLAMTAAAAWLSERRRS